MDALLNNFLLTFPTPVLFIVIAVFLFTLGKGADLLVNEAAGLSLRWGVPKMVIGATIVSLGTTLPETTVSVFAALDGNPDMALGNAIGSIIVDTSLIIGVAALIGSLPVDRKTMKRQGRIQLLAALMLAFASLPFLSAGDRGRITQLTGFLFLILLCLYIYMSIRWARKAPDHQGDLEIAQKPLWLQIVKLVAGIVVIIVSSKILIPSVEISAVRVGIPHSIIAATLVAFGTSLPELITAITAARKGHGELAIGNVVGADILNVLFVTGSAAAATKGGLAVPNDFYSLQIPAMLVTLLMFQVFAARKKGRISKIQGLVLICLYIIYLVLNYV